MHTRVHAYTHTHAHAHAHAYVHVGVWVCANVRALVFTCSNEISFNLAIGLFTCTFCSPADNRITNAYADVTHACTPRPRAT